MPIQLDKILADIAEEKPLHPHSEAAKSKKDQDDAWIKVGKKNKLSAHEAKSIFKVLQKKYEQEKMKSTSTWKLFNQMEDICRKHEEIKPKIEEEIPENEEESMVEFLEVREEDDEYDEESDNQDKSMRSNSPTSTPEKEVNSNAEIKQEPKVLNTNLMIAQANTAVKPDYTSSTQQQPPKQSAFTKALQNKGISLKKASQISANRQQPTSISFVAKPDRSILLPESIKRKLQNHDMEREEAAPAKKLNLATVQQTNITTTSSSNVQIPEVEIKKEVIDEMDTVHQSRENINLITIPSNNQTIARELSNGLTTIKSNGFNTQIEDLDFQKDIIFDNNPTTSSSKTCNHTAAPGEIINIGNFDNQLPPTFFKNLCNSNRHEALGLYVANVMNRVTGKTAAKLEINILKSIIEAQSDELARL